MNEALRTALAARRTYYKIGPDSPVADAEVEKLVEFALLNTPSPFNSQSGRVVLLLGDNHRKLWDLILGKLRAGMAAEKFPPTANKIAGFAAGHGSLLFYDDQAAVEKLQRDMPAYRDAFPVYSSQSAGMLQLMVWTLLRDAGIGASLQHYGNLIEAEAAEAWGVPPSWRLLAQMPFGAIQAEPGPKKQTPLPERLKVFR
ncbi:MAG: nitroreductase family protein [Planctomycetota bacterium]|jgi:predicted oxidoreductase (fatty acid repression mutant protein)|nr:nitroreductase family protein [Planctomycetota bacterium]